MCRNGLSRGLAFLLFTWMGVASGQTVPTAARIESVPLELTMPERYQVAESLEPIRRVTLVAPADGFIRSMDVRLGETVRGSQEIAQLDRTEASARVKLASAEVKEKQSLSKSSSTSQGQSPDVVEAQIEAAQAKLDLAQLALDRCTLRAPFGGRIVDLPVCAGQYVLKGTTIAELADLNTEDALARGSSEVAAGAPLTVHIEGQDVAGKVQAILPLPEHTRLCANWPLRLPRRGLRFPIPRETWSRGCEFGRRQSQSRPSPWSLNALSNKRMRGRTKAR